MKAFLALLFVTCCVGCSENKQPVIVSNAQQTNSQIIVTNGIITTNEVIWKTHGYLELIIENKSSFDIDDASLDFLGRPCTFGIVGAGVSAGYLGWTHPVGSHAIISWRVAKQLKNSVFVDISTIYKDSVDGKLVFLISGTNVVAQFKPVIRQ